MSETNNKKKKSSGGAVKFLIGVIVVIAVLIISSDIVLPKYTGDNIEGALIGEYYNDEPNHQVIFLGDCGAYTSFSPAVLWEEYGINSYVRGTAQQLIWHSYYILEDTLRYETPEVVVLSVTSMKHNTPQSEPYNRITLDRLKWSMTKFAAVQASMTEDENFIDYVFPVFRYHSRFDELTKEDFEYMFKLPEMSYNGYYMRADVKPVTFIPKPRVLEDYAFGENAMSYLNRIRILCERKGIKLMLVQAPALFPHWYDEYEEQIVEYAKRYNLTYTNLLAVADEIGIDFTTDTYDEGSHLNVYGVEKNTLYYGKILKEQCNLADLRSEEKLSASWTEKLAKYKADKLALEEKSGVGANVATPTEAVQATVAPTATQAVSPAEPTATPTATPEPTATSTPEPTATPTPEGVVVKEGKVTFTVKKDTFYIGETLTYRKYITATDENGEKLDVKIDSSDVNKLKAGEYLLKVTATEASGNEVVKWVRITMAAPTDEMVTEAADAIIKEIITPDMTKQEMISAIFLWIRGTDKYTGRHVQYASKSVDAAEGVNAAAYYAIMQGEGHCFGYAAVSEVLLNRVGIENMQIRRIRDWDNPNDYNHVWNLVNWGEGWYHFDTTPRADRNPVILMWTEKQLMDYSKVVFNYDHTLYPEVVKE